MALKQASRGYGLSIASGQIDGSSVSSKQHTMSFGLAWAIWAIAVCSLFFVQSEQTIAVSVFVVASTLYVLYQPGLALRAALSSRAPWLFVILASSSVLWSQHPDVSVRAAAEIAFTVGASLVMAHALPPRSCMLAWMFALLLADGVSLVDQRMVLNAGALAMVGIFGSKNQFGLSQAILILLCAWIGFDREQSPISRVAALIGFAGGSYLIVLGRSVDSTIVAIGALVCSVVAYRLIWFPPRSRMMILILIVVLFSLILSLLYLFADQINFFARILELSGKDATLTGRTDLWSRAAKLIEGNPILGTGLQAFWVEGNPYAEEIWARYDQARTGFHFHNLWYETAVQLGYVGVAVAFVTVSAATIEVGRWVLRSPKPESSFFFAFVVFTDVRTYLEVDLFGQFFFSWVLFLVAWSYARQARLKARGELRRSGPTFPRPGSTGG